MAISFSSASMSKEFIMNQYRIGFSEDIHPTRLGGKLVLGGVEIESSFGLAGHSDADVVLHAVTESIFGALALGDLGSHFPDNDPKYKGAASSLFVLEAVKEMEERGYEINNIDIQIAAAKPKLANHIESMRSNVAKLLKTEVENVSIKAMSFNNVGAIGEGKAIRAQAIVMLRKK